MKKPPRRNKPTRFVPRIALGAAVVCVIPACVAACNNGSMVSVAADAFGVADIAFPRDISVAADAFGVADIAFPEAGDAGDASDAPNDVVNEFSVADTGFSVADTGFGPG